MNAIKFAQQSVQCSTLPSIKTLLFARICRRILIAFLVSLALLTAYLAAWAFNYRLPATPARVIDLRKLKSDRPKCVTLCASLASNPVGFPGHAYVIWSPTEKIDIENDLSMGFMPCYFKDQIPSLFKDVPGAVLENVKGNTRNLDQLTIIVSESDYEQSKLLAKEFSGSKFKTGERDCVSFVNFVAGRLGLKTSYHGFIFPQDYLKQLKVAVEHESGMDP